MTLLLYAVADAQLPLQAAVLGVGGHPLFALGADPGLFAIVSDAPDQAPTGAERLIEYEQAVEALMEAATILPARFRTTLGDEDAVLDLLRTRRDELQAALMRVRGAVEMGLRARWPDAEQPHEPHERHAESATRGADYLRAKLERQRFARELAARLDATMADVARDRACRILPRADTPVAAAYLVDRERVPDFVALVGSLREDAELVCTGPWPPYSFTTEARR